MPGRAPSARTRASASSWPPSPRMPRPGHRALLARTGFEPVRHFFLMRNHDLGAVPEVPLPEGFELRRVVEADRRRIIEAENEAFRDHWGHREMTERTPTPRHTTGRSSTPTCGSWRGPATRSPGVVQNWIWPEENERLGVKRGWLEHISVRRPWRRRGLARAITAASLIRLRDAGLRGRDAGRRFGEPERGARAVRGPRLREGQQRRPPTAATSWADRPAGPFDNGAGRGIVVASRWRMRPCGPT